MTTSDLMLEDPGIVRSRWLMQMDFASGSMFVWNDYGPLYVAGQTWEGVGAFVDVDGVESVPGTSAHPLTVTLSGVDPRLIPLTQDSSQYRGRTATLWQCVFDDALQPVEPLLFRADGYMDLVSISMNGPTRTIKLTVESLFADRGFATHSTYSASAQRWLFPGDLGFNHQSTVAIGAYAVWPIIDED